MVLARRTVARVRAAAAEQVVKPRQERVGVECEWGCGCWTGGAEFEVVIVGEDGDGGAGLREEGQYVPRRVGGLDRLLMKLDFGSWFHRGDGVVAAAAGQDT